jgi:hypothetical protein
MRKSTLFISAALTTFMLAVLFGVASAYQNVIKSTGAVSQPTTSAVTENISLPQAAASSATYTPEQAADLAAKVIGRTDLYSVETADLNGVSAYLVTFSSGDLVYVSPQGQILSIVSAALTATAVPPVVVSGAPSPARRNNNGGGSQPPQPQPQPQPTQGGGGGGDDGGGGHDD